MDLHLFRPAVDSKGHLSVNGTDVLPHLGISFGLVLDGGFGMLPFDGLINQGDMGLVRCQGLLCGRIVDAQLTGTLHFNLGLANLLIVGVQVPVVVGAGANITVPGFYNDPMNDAGPDGDAARGLDHQSLGNIAIHGKIRLLRAERNDGFGLAAILQLELPTGDAGAFAGDPTFVLWPHLVGEWRPIRQVRVNLDVGYRLVVGDGAAFPVGGSVESAAMPRVIMGGSRFVHDDQLTFGLGASFRLGDAPLDLTAELYGNQILSGIDGRGELGAAGTTNLEALLGLKIFVERSSYLVIGGGGAIPTGGASAADVRAMVGFVFEPSIGDRDGDGLRDDVDQCPQEPEDFDGFADEDGCPDPDNDRDGILDVDDACPMVPEDRDGDADDDGCPEGNRGDRDGDGILDEADECPDEPEDRDDFLDQDGCPDPDNDRDGILDTDDLCPDEAEDLDGFQDADGCPDPDNDLDRILDVDDACPDRPEDYNGTEDEDGCPDVGVVELGDGVLTLFEEIHFATDSAEILPESDHILIAIAATLEGNPHLLLLEVQGHADDRGTDAYNIALTRDRAAAVVQALTLRGIAPSRLRSAGYGERCPVARGTSDAARAANRRVEIKILRTEDGPTGVEIACRAGRELVPR